MPGCFSLADNFQLAERNPSRNVFFFLQKGLCPFCESPPLRGGSLNFIDAQWVFDKRGMQGGEAPCNAEGEAKEWGCGGETSAIEMVLPRTKGGFAEQIILINNNLPHTPHRVIQLETDAVPRYWGRALPAKQQFIRFPPHGAYWNLITPSLHTTDMISDPDRQL